MKKFCIVFLIIPLLGGVRGGLFFAQTASVLPVISLEEKEEKPVGLRKHANEAFIRGEVLTYRAHYGWINAGEAVLEVKEESRKIGDRSTFHIVGLGYTTGAFNWFFKVRDRYETYIDEEAILPWVFIRRVNEGGYIINDDVVFNQIKNTAKSDGGVFEVPENVQDLLSMVYYARCIDYSDIKIGDEFLINVFLDDEVYEMKIKYYGKDIIKSRLGQIRCLRFKPMVQKGRIFEEKGDLTFWMSDDKNHIPIRLQADVLVGSIKLDLKSYSGLANPLAVVEE